ncbi:MAG: apolipoprotein N-acyltransferase [Candidatus Omnitrophota bacterium]|nr:apolipoprotein N-acyltransferase [Candidatus Omnitrophota bacterium]
MNGKRLFFVLALLSGILLGLAFPPVDLKWLAWVGLAPLLWAIRRCERPRRAFGLGYLAGFIFFLITLHPLVSAHAWTGWAVQTQAQFAARMSRQWWFMQGIWVLFSVWCALFWGLWAAGCRWLAHGRPWRMLVAAPSLWVLMPEWLRAQTTFGFTWAFLGNATADLAAIRQLAAFGGVWLLSVLVVIVNVSLAHALRSDETRRRWSIPAAALGVLVVAWFGGIVRQAYQPASDGGLKAAAIQYHRDRYTLTDFLDIGLDRSYLPMVAEALKQQARLVVLPESIALGALSLDGTPSSTKPKDRQTSRSAWERQMTSLLAGTDAVLVIGLDTVEEGRDHNTLVAWTRDGTAGRYHKRGLVPFSEYIPAGWQRIAIRGKSQYSPGQGSQLVRVSDDLVLGGFICQEVLRPELIRQSARDGATVLVTGGNDGVFADPAIAAIHADAAQLRAVETGRYVVRAMKTGISAVIDPTGREIARSRSSEPTTLTSRISPLTGQTPYVRFGDWFVWFSLVPILGCAILRRRDGP